MACAALLTACGVDLPDVRFTPMGSPDPAPNFAGLIVADEPEAATAAEKILQARGDAADAAAALALALAVTLPSRAGLAAGGVCLTHDSSGTSEVRFPERVEAAADAPPLVRALATLQARSGRLRWPQVVAPAEALARFGTATSHALAADLVTHGSVLLQDDQLLRTFMLPDHRLLATGDRFAQLALAEEFADVRIHEPSGPAAEASVWHPVEPRSTMSGQMFETSSVPSLAAATDASPDAGTAFAIGDADGNVVACALTMGQPFGRGKITAGYLLASSANGSALAASIVIGPEDGQPRFAAATASGPALIANALQAAEKSGRVGDVSAWFCPRNIVADGDRCDLLANRARFGYGRVVTPLPPHT